MNKDIADKIEKRLKAKTDQKIKEWDQMPKKMKEWLSTGEAFEKAKVDVEESIRVAEKYKTQMNGCYDNTLDVCKAENYDYYIGYLWTVDSIGAYPTPHAWCVKDGKVIDSTLAIGTHCYYDEQGILQYDHNSDKKDRLIYYPKMLWLGIKIPLDWVISVKEYKTKKWHDHHQLHYLHEYYMDVILGIPKEQVYVHTGSGEEGRLRFLDHFNSVIRADNLYDTAVSTSCHICGLDLHKADRVEKHIQVAHGG